MINGVTKVVMTKADVLDSFAHLNMCTSYLIDGKESKQVPFQMSRVKIEPQYQVFPGWNMDTSSLKKAKELPSTMNEYVHFINKHIGAPVKYISNGPGRDQIVVI
jgi:adenylosuccinate synthase